MPRHSTTMYSNMMESMDAAHPPPLPHGTFHGSSFCHCPWATRDDGDPGCQLPFRAGMKNESRQAGKRSAGRGGEVKKCLRKRKASGQWHVQMGWRRGHGQGAEPMMATGNGALAVVGPRNCPCATHHCTACPFNVSAHSWTPLETVRCTGSIPRHVLLSPLELGRLRNLVQVCKA
jgi:hypothetical protein